MCLGEQVANIRLPAAGLRRCLISCLVFATGLCGDAIAIAQVNYSSAVLYPLLPPNDPTFGNETATASVAGQTVGYVYDTAGMGEDDAYLWSDATSTPISLNPVGFSQSFAWATDGEQQVGDGFIEVTYKDHALLWSCTAASAVDLNPVGITTSQAFGISGNQQVGYGAGSATGGPDHALLWYGTAASAIDLNPAGVELSQALGTDGANQVGFSYVDGHVHALVHCHTMILG